MIILGITAFFHDSSAALMKDGKILFAIQEERLTKIKHDSSFPVNAISYCLKQTGITVDQIDYITYYEKPFLKFDRIINTFISFIPKGFNEFKRFIIDWSNKKLFIRRIIKKVLSKIDKTKLRANILFSSHHLSHAAMGYFSSEYSSSAILVIDGVGENATTSIYLGNRNKITLIKEYFYPNSYGLLYSSFTQFLGFRVNSDEYKLMGLSAYGDKDSEQTKKFIKLINEILINRKKKQSYFSINQEYFQFQYGNTMINIEKFQNLFKLKARKADSKIEQSHCNLAFAIQSVLEELLINIVKETKELIDLENIIISGGVAHNTLAMGKIRELNIFKNINIPFAPGDSGTSIGATLATWNIFLGKRNRLNIEPYLGSQFSNKEIQEYLNKNEISFDYFENFEDILFRTCNLLNENKVIGWFQGRSEFGERALGNRSIIADSTMIDGKEKLNSKIKFRENFRPFAPAIMEEDALDYFEAGDSKYMQFVTKILVKYRNKLDFKELNFKENVYFSSSDFPSVTHLDYTSRLQTVSKNNNNKFWRLLNKYKEITGVPMLINTSLNIKGQPIVENLNDVFSTFEKSGLDCMVIENFIITK